MTVNKINFNSDLAERDLSFYQSVDLPLISHKYLAIAGRSHCERVGEIIENAVILVNLCQKQITVGHCSLLQGSATDGGLPSFLRQRRSARQSQYTTATANLSGGH